VGRRKVSEPFPVDPSTLTTAQLLREVASLEKLVNQRMDAIEKAVTVAHENLVRVPTEVDKAIGHLREVMLEKFATMSERFTNIQTQFDERDVRVEQTAKDTKTAVDAALAAQEKSAGKQADSFALSIGKSETATTKQIDQLVQLIQQDRKATDDKVADIKDRLTRIEGTGQGRTDMWGWILAGVVALVAVAGFVLKG
jgi:DNA anti-recombination protein RmuC